MARFGRIETRCAVSVLLLEKELLVTYVRTASRLSGSTQETLLTRSRSKELLAKRGHCEKLSNLALTKGLHNLIGTWHLSVKNIRKA